MTKKIIDRLRNDEDYYGEFGQQFLSNSNIGTLLKKLDYEINKLTYQLS